MKTKINLIFALILCGATAIFAGDKGIIKTKSKLIKAESITANSSGVLTFKSGGATQQIKPGKYIYARISKPKFISSADKKLSAKQFGAAIEAYDKAYNKYKYLGWGSYCLYKKALAQAKMKKNKEAIATLKRIQKPIDPEEKKLYNKSKQLLTDLNIKIGNLKEARSEMNSIGKSSNPRTIAKSNNKQGDILLKDGKRKEALLMYLRTVLLIDKKIKERKTALKKVIKILKDDGNIQYKKFQKMLDSDY